MFEHLRTCVHCRKEHQQVMLGRTLAGFLEPTSAPDSLWENVVAALDKPDWRSPIPNSWRWRSLALAPRVWVALVLIGLVGFVMWQYSRHRQGVNADLDPYLQRVQLSTDDQESAAISSPLPGFVIASEGTDTQAYQQWDVSPLTGYRLSTRRTYKRGDLAVSQLVYSRGDDAFSVFVAPTAVQFSFGKRDIETVSISGINCRRVACPRTSMILFASDHYRWVLVSKTKDTNRLALIMNHFLGVRG